MTAQFPRGARTEALRRALADAAPSAAPTVADPADADEQEIVGWLTRLRRLEGVPFHYLVPDVGMLPAESIRFFQVDPNWISALVDGAFSVGAPPSAQPADRARLGAPEPMSGFLLRSAAVSGWPGIEAQAYGDAAGTDALAQVRLERIAPSILLGLFTGVLRRLELTEPAEALHFGADPDGRGGWTKAPRYARSGGTHQIGDPVTAAAVPVPLRPFQDLTHDHAVVRAADLAAAFDPVVWPGPRPNPDQFDAGLFALEMVEGVQAVSFTVP
jgi:hypothetical protein